LHGVLGFQSQYGKLTSTSSGRNTHMEKIRIDQHSFTGMLWFGAWLFTIGFLQLTFGKGFLAIILWPYYIGVYLHSVFH
jgi:hypothetical protein